MKQISLILIAFVCYINSFAQEDGYGFYVGYQLGKYTPGLGNISATTNMYNDKYSADFNYTDNIPGLNYGFKTVMYKYYQVDLQVIRRKSVVESEYINPDNNELWKLGFKSKYNSIMIGNAIHFHPFAVGIGFEIGRFKLYSRNGKETEYNNLSWNKNNQTLYGDKVILAKFLDFTGGYIVYAECMPKYFGVRVFYSVPMGAESYEKPADLIFYRFKPSSFGVSLLFNMFMED